MDGVVDADGLAVAATLGAAAEEAPVDGGGVGVEPQAPANAVVARTTSSGAVNRIDRMGRPPAMIAVPPQTLRSSDGFRL
jgi:hypothetical protein